MVKKPIVLCNICNCSCDWLYFKQCGNCGKHFCDNCFESQKDKHEINGPDLDGIVRWVNGEDGTLVACDFCILIKPDY